MTSPVVCVSARLDILPERLDTALQALKPLVAATRLEDGCLQYDAHQCLDDPGRILIFERWALEGPSGRPRGPAPSGRVHRHRHALRQGRARDPALDHTGLTRPEGLRLGPQALHPPPPPQGLTASPIHKRIAPRPGPDPSPMVAPGPAAVPASPGNGLE